MVSDPAHLGISLLGIDIDLQYGFTFAIGVGTDGLPELTLTVLDQLVEQFPLLELG